MRRPAAVFLALALAAIFPQAAARAQDAPPDSLGLFLRGLADSTDAYFGVSGARPDTAGLDSALAYALANPRRYRARRGFQLWPKFAFNRADGPTWGAASAFEADPYGRLSGGARWAAGADEWLWDARWQRNFVGPSAHWTAHARGLRGTRVVDRERGLSQLTTLRALIYGSDSRHYYRTEGIELRLEREATTWRAGVWYRDGVEGPLATTTGWNLARKELSVFDNIPVTHGRVREFTFDANWQVPFAPVTAEIEHSTSGAGIDSDLEYRRTRVNAAGEFAVGRFAALVPQVMYGRVYGRLEPQVAFYLGGAHTLRSMETSSLGGSGIALARLDLIGAPDLLALARIPHPAILPVQGAVFAATGAVWGDDPYGGPERPGTDWPRARQWLSEAGFSLIWQPGLPDPEGYFRFDYTVPIGPDRPAQTRWTVAYTRALDLIEPFTPEHDGN